MKNVTLQTRKFFVLYPIEDAPSIDLERLRTFDHGTCEGIGLATAKEVSSEEYR